MKRFIYILLCVILAAGCIVPGSALAETEEFDDISTPHILLYEADSGTVLYERAAQERAYPASTTKIMTCIVALDHFSDIDTTYTCGYEAVDGFGQQSSLLHLQRGYVVTIRDLLYGLMLVSGNDCGACLAVACCGSTSAFVEEMNKKAEELGMKDTHYMNAHGLHHDEHYTTAYDMALLMSYALKNDDFREIISATEYTVNELNGKFTRTINTSNKLLYCREGDPEDDRYEYSIGGKTGETNVAGYTLVEAAEKDGVRLVAVLMGDSNQGNISTYYRFRNAIRLFNWGFDHYVCYDYDDFNIGSEPVSDKINLNNAFNVQTTGYKVDDPNKGVITATADLSDIRICGTNDEIGEVTDSSFLWAEPELDPAAIEAPVAVGDTLGTIALYFNDEVLMNCPLIAATAIAAADGEANPGDKDNPSATTIIDGKSGSHGEKFCNLTVSKNTGDDKYTVWVYYDKMLCTMDGTSSYFLYYDGEVFRTSTSSQDKTISLYRIYTNDEGGIWYTPDAEAESGGKYIVVSNGYALKSEKDGRSLMGVKLEFDDQGNLISSVGSDMIWEFTQKGSSADGYQLCANDRYLHRNPGDGLIFWIIIGVLVIALAVIIRLLTAKKSRFKHRHRSSYRIYRP